MIVELDNTVESNQEIMAGYMTSFRSLEEMLTSRLYESRERFELVSKVVRKKSGNVGFDAIAMALTKIYGGLAYSDKNYRICSAQLVQPDGSIRTLDNYEADFTYHFSKIPGRRGNSF